MKAIIAILALTVLLSGCATSSDPGITDAVADYIQVAEIMPQDQLRTYGDYSYRVISQRYIIVATRRESFLVEFVRDCRELDEFRVTPDYRREANLLRARFDTIRGCHIGKIYAVDKGQAQELENLGDAPGD